MFWCYIAVYFFLQTYVPILVKYWMDRPPVIGGGDLRMFDLGVLRRRHHQLGQAHQFRNLNLLIDHQLALLHNQVALHRQHCVSRQPVISVILTTLRMPSSTQDLFAVMPQLLVTKTVMCLLTKTVMPLKLLATKTVRHVTTLMYQLLVMHQLLVMYQLLVTSSHVWVPAETVMHGLMYQLVTNLGHVEALPLEAGHPACHVLDHHLL